MTKFLAGCRMPRLRLQTGCLPNFLSHNVGILIFNVSSVFFLKKRRSGQRNCDWTVNQNKGCTVAFPGDLSYGPSFNNNGGGWYVILNTIFFFNNDLYLPFRFAVERTDAKINVWFWDRCSYFVPPEIKLGLPVVHPITWVYEIYLYTYICITFTDHRLSGLAYRQLPECLVWSCQPFQWTKYHYKSNSL